LDVRLRGPPQGIPRGTGLVLSRAAALDPDALDGARGRWPVALARWRTPATQQPGTVPVVLGHPAGRLLLPLEGQASPLPAAWHAPVGGPGGAGGGPAVAVGARRAAMVAPSRAWGDRAGIAWSVGRRAAPLAAARSCVVAPCACRRPAGRCWRVLVGLHAQQP